MAWLLENGEGEVTAASERAMSTRDKKHPTVPGTVGTERRLNAFLRVDETAVQARVAAKEGVSRLAGATVAADACARVAAGAGGVATMSAIRALKVPSKPLL